jgi:uncharacterized damage-inducible protein DinB
MTKTEMLASLAMMKEYFDRSTRILEESDSAFAPKAGMFTAAQVVAHVAQTVDWFFTGAFAAGGFDTNFERMDREVRATTSLTAARKWIEKAFAGAKTAVESHTDKEWTALLPPGPIMGGQPRHVILGAIFDHTAHHRGALTVYSRLRDKVPPMPYMEM